MVNIQNGQISYETRNVVSSFWKDGINWPTKFGICWDNLAIGGHKYGHKICLGVSIRFYPMFAQNCLTNIDIRSVLSDLSVLPHAWSPNLWDILIW